MRMNVDDGTSRICLDDETSCGLGGANVSRGKLIDTVPKSRYSARGADSPIGANDALQNYRRSDIKDGYQWARSPSNGGDWVDTLSRESRRRAPPIGQIVGQGG